MSADNLLLPLQKYGLSVGIMCWIRCHIIYEVLSGSRFILVFEIIITIIDYFNLD